jgi:hypothetical protein
VYAHVGHQEQAPTQVDGGVCGPGVACHARTNFISRSILQDLLLRDVNKSLV